MTAFPKPGDCFKDRYEILAEVGSGGFSRVYRARQRGLDREVALKILRPMGTADGPRTRARWEDWSKRFEREARLVSKLRDPHTVTVHDYGETASGLWYIVFEYIDGDTVAQARSTGPLAPERVVDILTQVLQSLEEAHQQGVLHRDIKPDNLMLYEHVGRKDRVKVLDFGIAKGTPDGADQTVEEITRDGYLLGTPRYMAPEQIREETTTPASDIYSLGLVAWEMLAGKPAITHHETVSIISRQVDPEPFELPEQLSVPPWLRSVVSRMIAKDPTARFASARQVLDALEAGPKSGFATSDTIDTPSPDTGALQADGGSPLSASGQLIDPNLDASDGGFEPASDDRKRDSDTVDRLARDLRGSAQLDTSARSSKSAAAPVENDLELDIEEQDRDSAGKREEDGTLSKLTMLGVEEMLRRSKRGADGMSWRKLAFLGALLAVVGGVGFGGYTLYHAYQKPDSAPIQEATQTAKDWVVYPVTDALAPAEDRFSFQGLQLIIKGAGWNPVGAQGVIDTATSRKVLQTYRQHDTRIETTIHDVQTRPAARKIVRKVAPPVARSAFRHQSRDHRAGW